MTNADELRKQVELLEELRRRKSDDPIFLFEPHRGQTAFIKSVLNGDKDEDWFLAANRSGKSDAGAYIGASLARFGDQSDRPRYVGGQGSSVQVRDRATSGWVSALTHNLSNSTIQPKYFDNDMLPPGQGHRPFIPSREIERWDKENNSIKLKNGSIIEFKSADSGRKKYQGAEKDWIHFDEEHPEDIYEESVIRVGGRKMRFFCTATLLPPEGTVGGITWVYNKIVIPWKQGKKQNIGLFNCSIYDNPHIDPNEVRRLESIYPVGSLQRRIRLDGEMLPGKGGSRAYGNFAYPVHVKDDLQVNPRIPLAWMCDFNVDPLCSLVGQYERGIFRIFKELILEDAVTSDMAQAFFQAYPSHGAPIHIFGDASGSHQHHRSKHTDYQILLNELKTYPVPIKLFVKEKNPSVSARINAVNHALLGTDGSVGLEIDSSCVELVADLEQVQRDNKQGIKKTANPKDPYYKRTHTSDALGYWIEYIQPVVPDARGRSEEDFDSIPSPHYGHR